MFVTCVLDRACSRASGVAVGLSLIAVANCGGYCQSSTSELDAPANAVRNARHSASVSLWITSPLSGGTELIIARALRRSSSNGIARGHDSERHKSAALTMGSGVLTVISLGALNSTCVLDWRSTGVVLGLTGEATWNFVTTSGLML